MRKNLEEGEKKKRLEAEEEKKRLAKEKKGVSFDTQTRLPPYEHAPPFNNGDSPVEPEPEPEPHILTEIDYNNKGKIGELEIDKKYEYTLIEITNKVEIKNDILHYYNKNLQIKDL